MSHRGVEQLVARRAHNPEVRGSSPLSATNSKFHRAGISQPALLFFQDNHYLREYFKHYFA